MAQGLAFETKIRPFGRETRPNVELSSSEHVAAIERRAPRPAAPHSKIGLPLLVTWFAPPANNICPSEDHVTRAKLLPSKPVTFGPSWRARLRPSSKSTIGRSAY